MLDLEALKVNLEYQEHQEIRVTLELVECLVEMVLLVLKENQVYLEDQVCQDHLVIPMEGMLDRQEIKEMQDFQDYQVSTNDFIASNAYY